MDMNVRRQMVMLVCVKLMAKLVPLISFRLTAVKVGDNFVQHLNVPIHIKR